MDYYTTESIRRINKIASFSQLKNELQDLNRDVQLISSSYHQYQEGLLQIYESCQDALFLLSLLTAHEVLSFTSEEYHSVSNYMKSSIYTHLLNEFLTSHSMNIEDFESFFPIQNKSVSVIQQQFCLLINHIQQDFHSILQYEKL